MAKKQSTLEDIMDIAAKLPWWIGVLLAVVTYFFFHYFATKPPPVLENVQSVNDTSPILYHALIKGFSTALQYLLPIALIGGAILSAINQYKNRRIYNNVTQSDSSNAIDSLSWESFERLLSEAFKRQSYSVYETESGPDDGIDLVLSKDGQKIYVQCKHWKSRRVGVGVVRELLGVVSANKASGGIVVCSGEFTLPAHEFANKSEIQLIDGSELRRMLDSASASTSKVPPVNIATLEKPPCPKCGKWMVRRKAKRGPNAGTIFWGCSSFPNCRGTRDI